MNICTKFHGNLSRSWWGNQNYWPHHLVTKNICTKFHDYPSIGVISVGTKVMYWPPIMPYLLMWMRKWLQLMLLSGLLLHLILLHFIYVVWPTHVNRRNCCMDRLNNKVHLIIVHRQHTKPCKTNFECLWIGDDTEWLVIMVNWSVFSLTGCHVSEFTTSGITAIGCVCIFISPWGSKL